MFKIVGLGNKAGDLTITGRQAILSADVVFAKTTKSDTYEFFKNNNINAVSLDFIFENAENFDELDSAMVNFLLKNEKENSVFCVLGDGLDDSTALYLNKQTEVEFLGGVSKCFPAKTMYPAMSATVLSASMLLARPSLSTDIPLIVYELYDRIIASEIKLYLLDVFGMDKEAYLFADKIIKISLSELDHFELDHRSTLIVPSVDLIKKERFDFNDLMRLIERLREPDGCMWDRAQTHETLRANVLEEAYEFVEAIDKCDTDMMLEESGDVLLQSAFHAELAEEYGEYNASDMLTAVCKKIITRHTHIFGENHANNQEEALKFWEQAKMKEKGQKGMKDKIDSVPETFSALMRSNKIQKIAAKVGFDFKKTEDAKEKLLEEINELLNAEDNVEEEGGDVLFAAVNLIRFFKLDPEVALAKANRKFEKRFLAVEKYLKESGKTFENSTLLEMDIIWEKVKKDERK